MLGREKPEKGDLVQVTFKAKHTHGRKGYWVSDTGFDVLLESLKGRLLTMQKCHIKEVTILEKRHG